MFCIFKLIQLSPFPRKFNLLHWTHEIFCLNELFTGPGDTSLNEQVIVGCRELWFLFIIFIIHGWIYHVIQYLVIGMWWNVSKILPSRHTTLYQQYFNSKPTYLTWLCVEKWLKYGWNIVCMPTEYGWFIPLLPFFSTITIKHCHYCGNIYILYRRLISKVK